MPNQIALITDSTCDLPSEWIKEHEITVVPLSILWGDEHYLDRVTLSPEDFYARLETSKIHPTTSQPTPGDFLKAYCQAAEAGAKEVVVCTISSAMSGTIGSARQAAQESPIPVHIVDSRNNSMGLGWQVMAAARVRQAGGSIQEMLRAADDVRKRMVYYISLDTMEYLTKGGRIGGAVKFLSSVLQIKPLIYVNPESGTVGASIPARSRSSAIEGLYKQFFSHLQGNGPKHIMVLHNAALPEATALMERVRAEHNPAELLISIVSPVLGVHTGPRAVALCGYAEA